MRQISLHIWLFVWLLTQIVSLTAVIFLFTLGLILIEFLLYPLALGIGALLSGLTAVWASNRLVKDGLQTSMEAVVLRCELAAAILSLILIAASAAGFTAVPPILTAGAAAFFLALVAVYSTVKLRHPPLPGTNSPRRAIALLVIALMAIPAVIFLASLFGWAGA
jgi:small-conductance mechanosensitive channel